MKADLFKVMGICIFFLFPRMKDVVSSVIQGFIFKYQGS